MVVLFFMWIISFFFGILFLTMSIMLSENFFLSSDSEGSYECGFSPILFYQLPYSAQFFKIAVMFLLFDVELLVLMPVIFSLSLKFFDSFFGSLIFILVLVLGFLYEWGHGMLEWV